MKMIVSAFALACFISGCVSATTAATDDSAGGGNSDKRTNLCNDATPPPCNPPKD